MRIDQIHTLCGCPEWDLWCWLSAKLVEVGTPAKDGELSMGSVFTAIFSLCFRTLWRKDDLIAAEVKRFRITKLFRAWAKDSVEVSYPWSPWLCWWGCKICFDFTTMCRKNWKLGQYIWDKYHTGWKCDVTRAENMNALTYFLNTLEQKCKRYATAKIIFLWFL